MVEVTKYLIKKNEREDLTIFGRTSPQKLRREK